MMARHKNFDVIKNQGLESVSDIWRQNTFTNVDFEIDVGHDDPKIIME